MRTRDQLVHSAQELLWERGYVSMSPKAVQERAHAFGVMSHVYSTYESRTNLDDAKPMARGVKSFELLNSNNRWYILQVYWDSERPDNPLPEQYMHDGVR